MKSVVPTAPAMAIRFFCAASCSTARATDELSKPMTISTLRRRTPLPCDCDSDIGLALVVADQHLDRLAEHL